jgi:hypothetical protein
MTARTPGSIPLRDAKTRCNIPSTAVQSGSTWTRAPEASASSQFTAGTRAMPVPWHAEAIRISRLPVARTTQKFPTDLGQVLEARFGGFACGFAGDVHQLASSAKAVRAPWGGAPQSQLRLCDSPALVSGRGCLGDRRHLSEGRCPHMRGRPSLLSRGASPFAVAGPRDARRLGLAGARCTRPGSRRRRPIDTVSSSPSPINSHIFVLPMFPSSARARGTGMSRGLSLSLERCSFRGLTGLISGLSVRA